MTDAEREANDRAALRNLELQIEDVQRRLANWRMDWRGRDVPLAAITERERLEDELRELRAERLTLTAGDAQTQAYRRALLALQQWVGDLKQRMDRLEQRIDDLERRIAGWFAQDASERVERQEALDRLISDLQSEIRRGAEDWAQQLREVYRALVVVAVLVIAGLIALGALVVIYR